MSASYLGTFPVKAVTSTDVIPPGVRTSSARIVGREADVADLIPSVNSTYEFDSSLWVTQAAVVYPGNGFGEISITAAGPDPSASTVVEIQPGSPLIYGLADENGSGEQVNSDDIPLRYGPNYGTAVKVTFVTEAGQEKQILEQYAQKIMPNSVLGVSLPVPARGPGPWPQLYRPNTFTTLYIGSYKGWLCRDVTMQRQGRALVVSLFFKESGRLDVATGPDSSITYTTLFDF